MSPTNPGVRTEIEQRGGGTVARVVIDNEPRLNTLTGVLMDQLAVALEGLQTNPDLRVLVLTGGGSRAFIGGADIDEMAALDAATSRPFITRIHRVCDALRRLPVPAIARIQGYCLGGGLEIAASCDLRIAAADSIFGMPEVRLGIPSVVEAALLPMLVGWGRARRIMLLGDTFPAADAERWGLIERVVPTERLDEAVDEWLAAILAGGPRAIRLQKELMQAWETLPLGEAVAAGIDAFEKAWRSDEPRDTMAHFLAARAARRR